MEGAVPVEIELDVVESDVLAGEEGAQSPYETRRKIVTTARGFVR
jgi:hypothetical protein